MPPICASCGKYFSVIKVHGQYVAVPDDHPDECQRCWDAEMDRTRLDWTNPSTQLAWF
jgi:hypothetical protein